MGGVIFVEALWAGTVVLIDANQSHNIPGLPIAFLVFLVLMVAGWRYVHARRVHGRYDNDNDIQAGGAPPGSNRRFRR